MQTQASRFLSHDGIAAHEQRSMLFGDEAASGEGVIPSDRFNDHDSRSTLLVSARGAGRRPRRRLCRRVPPNLGPLPPHPQGFASREPKCEALLTLPEVAAVLRVSPATVYRLVALRQIRFIKLRGGIRLRREDLAEFLNRTSVDPVSL